MNVTSAFLHALAALPLLVASYAHGEDSAIKPNAAPPAALSPAAAPDKAKQKPDAAALENLDLRRRVAQLMLVTLEGTHRPNSAEVKFMSTHMPAGVVIRRVRQPSDAAFYIQKMKAMEAASGLPLLVGANLYELTAVDVGFKHAWMQVPTPLSLAAAPGSPAADKMAGEMAKLLHSLGFNFHLGPSLALAPTLPSAVGSVWCLGSDPEGAARTAQSFCAAFAKEGIMEMPMSFPGGGQNREGNSPAVLLTPAPLADAQDLLPYKRAIEQGCRLMQVGPTRVPTLDPQRLPACLSPVVIRDILRGRMGFTGLVAAGPMDSEDISGEFDPADAAQRALEAGADLIYWRGADKMVERAIDRIVTAAADGRMKRSVIDDAVKRVIDFKFAMGQKAVTPPGENKAERYDSHKGLNEAVRNMERQSITLIKNDNGVLPLDKKKSQPIAVTGVVGVELLHNALEEHIKPIAMQEIKTAAAIGEIKDFEIGRLTGASASKKTVILIFTDRQRQSGQRALLHGIKSKGAKVVVLYLGYPQHAAEFSEADAILLGYCDAGNASATVLAMADVLLGRAPAEVMRTAQEFEVVVGQQRAYKAIDVARTPVGRLPVALGDTVPAGYALTYGAPEAIDTAEWEFPGGAHGGAEAKYTFTAPGAYSVTLRMTDRYGAKSEGAFRVVAKDAGAAAPVAQP